MPPPATSNRSLIGWRVCSRRGRALDWSCSALAQATRLQQSVQVASISRRASDSGGRPACMSVCLSAAPSFLTIVLVVTSVTHTHKQASRNLGQHKQKNFLKCVCVCVRETLCLPAQRSEWTEHLWIPALIGCWDFNRFACFVWRH